MTELTRAPRILVVYGTTDGQTGKIAAAIGESLRAAGASAEVANAEGLWNPAPEDFAGVIVAASVHAGGYQRAVAKWVHAHASALRQRPTVFVSVCLGVLEQKPSVNEHLRLIMERFFTQTSWQPTETKIVAGALKYRQYNWLKRWMMKRIVAKAHGDTDTSRDYEYTDWSDLKTFTERWLARVRERTTVAIAS